jgi:hypothetical protein
MATSFDIAKVSRCAYLGDFRIFGLAMPFDIAEILWPVAPVDGHHELSLCVVRICGSERDAFGAN